METTLTFRASFASATRRSGGADTGLHGHTYFVSATMVEPKTPSYSLGDDLRAIARELHEHELEKMMPGASTDLPGIARWFMERLLTTQPRVVSVTVAEDSPIGDVSATATRTERAL